MNNSRLLALVLSLSALLASAPLHAQGDADAGATKSQPCMGCHAIPGYFNVYPNYRVPKLAGQHRAYIVAALKAYKAGQRSHKTMVAQASTLSEEDMQDIAAYFETIASKGK